MPFYDPDTKLVFLIGKGTNKLFIAEFQSKVPHLSPVYEMSLAEQNLGACLGSKRKVTVMDGEVDTLYQLTKHSILPIPCIVPRRSYRDFHADLFPDTRGSKAGCTSAEWLAGSNELVSFSTQFSSTILKRCRLLQMGPAVSSLLVLDKTPSTPSPVALSPTIKASAAAPAVEPVAFMPRPRSQTHPSGTACSVPQSNSVHVTSHVSPSEAKMEVKELVYTVDDNSEKENDLKKFVAVPLKGPAGVVGIYDVEKPGKLPDGVMDGIFNKAQVTDLHWNPFDDEELAVGTDVGLINFWRLTRDDGPRNEMAPEKVMNVGGEKILCFQWHPMASDLLAVALSDSSIEIWESQTFDKVEDAWMICVLDRAHSGRVLYACDDRLNYCCGDDEKFFASDCHSSLFCVHTLRLRLLACASFSGAFRSLVHLFDAASLNDIYTQQIDSGTQPLVPHYDYDSSVLFLSSKGSRTINMFEVSCDSPYLLPLTPYTAPLIGQAMAFHNKKRCDVMAVEFQRAWRLTERTLEQVIFRVPRVKKDVFQSDLFPDALVTWRPVMTAEEWLAGSSKTPQFESLMPEGVSALGKFAYKDVFQSDLFPDALVTWRPVMTAEEWLAGSSKTPQFESLMPEGVSALAKPAAQTAPTAQRQLIPRLEHADEPKAEPDRKEVQSSWSSKIVEDRTLEQDNMEGVSEDEWTEAL
ncbi:hypothetical protein COOONC_14679 [Cooperia oncophora]